MSKIEWQFEFPPEVQAEREPVLAALRRAMKEATAEACLEAQTLAGEWLARHPEDLTIWDAGEPIAMLADAIAWVNAQKDRDEMEEWKREKEEWKREKEEWKREKARRATVNAVQG